MGAQTTTVAKAATTVAKAARRSPTSVVGLLLLLPALVVAVAACPRPTPEDDPRPVAVMPEMPGPLLTWTRCVDVISDCRGGGLFGRGRPLLDCLHDAPVCTPSDLARPKPPSCCPAACIDVATAALMAHGEQQAWHDVFNTPHDCAPGSIEGMKAWKAEVERVNDTINRPALDAWDERRRQRLEQQRPAAR